ncbi:hypothetical protein V1294_005448 [Bradyrhizobium sp. AZCC 1678]|uniref:hypothetical protein n=1 Tax=Bradyrhizobium sp. AZCC 1678 TaxID=3117030 RepID=UPI002FF41504
MRFFKAIGLGVLFLFIGLAGTLAIIIAANLLITAQNPIMLRSGISVYTDSWDRGYVMASGTWTMENARQAFPIQTSKIRCIREEKSCTAAQAEISFGNMLHLETYSYDITKWDSTTILFRTDTDCVEYVYTVDRSNKRLVGTRTKKTNTGSDCTMVEDKPLRLTLVDGFDVWKNINQEVEAKYVPFVWLTVAAWWLLLGLIMFLRRRPSRLTNERGA